MINVFRKVVTLVREYRQIVVHRRSMMLCLLLGLIA
jgi:hypothetical protein